MNYSRARFSLKNYIPNEGSFLTQDFVRARSAQPGQEKTEEYLSHMYKKLMRVEQDCPLWCPLEDKRQRAQAETHEILLKYEMILLYCAGGQTLAWVSQ